MNLKRKRKQISKRRRNKSATTFERLEPRKMLATFALNRGTDTFEIRGTVGSDVIHVSELAGSGQITATVNGARMSYNSGLVDRIQVFGFSGNDTITNDTDLPSLLAGGAGDDTLTGGSAADILYGQAGDDVSVGLGGNDTIADFAGTNSLDGGLGNDRIFGGTGVDTILGGAGNDRLVGKGGNDIIFGGAGVDDLLGGAGDDFLDPEAGGVAGSFIQAADLSLIHI